MCEENEMPQDAGTRNASIHDEIEEPLFFVEERLLQNKVLKLMIEKIKDPDSPLSSQGKNGEETDNVKN